MVIFACKVMPENPELTGLFPNRFGPNKNLYLDAYLNQGLLCQLLINFRLVQDVLCTMGIIQSAQCFLKLDVQLIFTELNAIVNKV